MTELDSPVATNEFDILTTVAHELGHLIGVPHSDHVDDVLAESLDTGVRKDVLAGIDGFFDDALHALELLE